jgi:hypothetical protein
VCPVSLLQEQYQKKDDEDDCEKTAANVHGFASFAVKHAVAAIART